MKCKANQLSANGTCERFDTPCIKKACRFFQPPQTNADRIRSKSDEELAKMLYNGDDLGYCKNLPECGDLLDTEEGIPEEKCISCILNWLRQPVEEAQNNA